MDLEQYPHAFVAGETGSGKSVILKCMIHQALEKNYDVSLVDFKRGVSFASFKGVVNIHYEYKDTLQLFKKLVEETKKRLDLFRNKGVESLKNYNLCTPNPLSRKVVFVDELAELLKIRDKEISNILYDSIETLTRLSRAVGIHLIMGIQRPDSTVISGQIKSNVAYRVCGKFVDKEPSRIMLGSDKASLLPNIKGRFIIKDNEFHEVQAFYYDNSLYKPCREPAVTIPTKDVEEEKEASRALQASNKTSIIDFEFNFDNVLKPKED